MCGIVGSVSTRNIVPVLVQGLQRLEYRGYDSCGVAVYVDGLQRARFLTRRRLPDPDDLVVSGRCQMRSIHTDIVEMRISVSGMLLCSNFAGLAAITITPGQARAEALRSYARPPRAVQRESPAGFLL